MALCPLSDTFRSIQRSLFPALEEELGELCDSHRRVVETLELLDLPSLVRYGYGECVRGRPRLGRLPFLKAFVAKVTLGESCTRSLLDRLYHDLVLRRLCGWEERHRIPSEATFSRVFAEFAETGLPERIHARLAGRCSRLTAAGRARCRRFPRERPGQTGGQVGALRLPELPGAKTIPALSYPYRGMPETPRTPASRRYGSAQQALSLGSAPNNAMRSGIGKTNFRMKREIHTFLGSALYCQGTRARDSFPLCSFQKQTGDAMH